MQVKSGYGKTAGFFSKFPGISSGALKLTLYVYVGRVFLFCPLFE